LQISPISRISGILQIKKLAAKRVFFCGLPLKEETKAPLAPIAVASPGEVATEAGDKTESGL
jgi:hypothetical protein